MTNSGISRRVKREFRSCKSCGKTFDVLKMQCPSCKAWDAPTVVSNDETILLSDVSELAIRRINTGPWDKIFSSNQSTGETGVVSCQAMLIGGAPGSGKSTLSLQLSDEIAEIEKREVLYIAAEEAAPQIKDRGIRLKIRNPSLVRVYPLGAGSDIGEIIQRRKPCAIIVDSLQGLTKNLEQQVEYCKALKEYSVVLDAPSIIISQVTKQEDMAGLMALQHEVDTCALFTIIDKHKRLLENEKNRFGQLQRIFFKMTETGLVETKAPKEYEDESDGEFDPDWNDNE